MFKISKSKHLNLVKVFQAGLGKIPAVRKRRRLNWALRIIKYFSYAAIGLFLLVIIFFGSLFIALELNFKQIYQDIAYIVSDKSDSESVKLSDLPAEDYGEGVDYNNLSLSQSSRELDREEKGREDDLKPHEQDYLMIVDSQIVVSETEAARSPDLSLIEPDEAVNKSVNYKIEQGVNGVFAKLRVNYANNSELGNYRAYTKIYAPLGSELIKARGVFSGETESALLDIYELNDRQWLKECRASGWNIEKCGVNIQDEFARTSFSAPVFVKSGEAGSLHFEYKLPKSLNKAVRAGRYELFIQKQPSDIIEELGVDLETQSVIKSYSPTGFYVERMGERKVVWRGDLRMDRMFRVKF